MVVSWKIYECFFERELLKTLPCECWDENGMRESLLSFLGVFLSLFFSLMFPFLSLHTSLVASVFLLVSPHLCVCLLPALTLSTSPACLPTLTRETSPSPLLTNMAPGPARSWLPLVRAGQSRAVFGAKERRGRSGHAGCSSPTF